MSWEDLRVVECDWFVGLLEVCIRKTKPYFVIDRNYRYKNYAFGEYVSKVIEQYADGSLFVEQKREFRKAGG